MKTLYTHEHFATVLTVRQHVVYFVINYYVAVV